MKVVIVKLSEGLNKGVLYLSSALKKAGHEVDYVDTSQKVKGDLVLLSANSMNYQKAIGFAREVEGNVALGGPHATATAKETMQNFSFINFIVAGEAEQTIVELADAIEHGKDVDKVAGIYFRRDGKIIKTAVREGIANLDDLPLPDYDLIKIEGAVPINFSRGCLYNCGYCTVPSFWGKIRWRSIDNAMKEIEILKKKGVKEILITDDSFVVNKELLDEFCSRISGMQWSVTVLPGRGSKELFDKIKKAGCTKVYVSADTGSSRIAHEAKLGGEDYPQVAMQTVYLARQAGLEVEAGFMVGWPNEDIHELENTKNLAFSMEKIGAVTHASLLIPMQGSDLMKNHETYIKGVVPKSKEFEVEWIRKFPDLFPVFYTFSKMDSRVLHQYCEVISRSGARLETLKRISKPTSEQDFIDLGNVALEVNEFEAAIASYEKAIGLNKDNFSAVNNLAFCLTRVKNFGRAIEVLSGALENAKGDIRVKLVNNLVEAYLKNQQPGKSVELLEAEIKNHPEKVYFHNLIAIYKALKKDDEAVELQKEMHKL